MFHRVYVLHLVCPFICQWTCGVLPLFSVVNEAAVSMGAHAVPVPLGIPQEWNGWNIE